MQNVAQNGCKKTNSVSKASFILLDRVWLFFDPSWLTCLLHHTYGDATGKCRLHDAGEELTNFLQDCTFRKKFSPWTCLLLDICQLKMSLTTQMDFFENSCLFKKLLVRLLYSQLAQPFTTSFWPLLAPFLASAMQWDSWDGTLLILKSINLWTSQCYWIMQVLIAVMVYL